MNESRGQIMIMLVLAYVLRLALCLAPCLAFLASSRSL
jgi:hypothetical protein